MASIRPAVPEDLAAVLTLLKDCGLPYQDVDAESLGSFLIADEGQVLIGSIGLERYGTDALLRSLAVRADHRSTGLGKRLATAAEEHARKAGIAMLYLLTTTAADFFARRGYEMIARPDAPAALQETAEFSSLCPSQAVCMRKTLS